MICSKPLILQVGKWRPRAEAGPTKDTERGRSIAEIQPQDNLISKPRLSALGQRGAAGKRPRILQAELTSWLHHLQAL